MDAILQSEIFFFISSVGFIFLWILVAIFLIYLIRATNTFSRILNRLVVFIIPKVLYQKYFLSELKFSTVVVDNTP
ncbi:hypothetical protein A3H53_03890 [Candidatus Nomurabacteria bacterium RIFCSPLOWO2_02_FULL_40_10]|uniref:Uncharacterized protein n=2 Tax=Candidatus Nomuraibacteriota TaxID=1752729 RepID=A0A1F6XVW9_9BACT|nr:MAG: hypothetical protein A2642_01355 [Candidatus Nomurabacteria bacterium RIFCSPHIGHO2_01_FULL_39_10]OGI98254.1 MAG: hypothetical protein A3H53_03890 [Candidatus Nomurabacteria bacterium RIFCSPLOWO2_02_FULL_40_10]